MALDGVPTVGSGYMFSLQMKRAIMFVLGTSTNFSHASLASQPHRRNTSVACLKKLSPSFTIDKTLTPEELIHLGDPNGTPKPINMVYKGLDIVTNKVSNEKCRGVPHHLLGIICPEVDFTVDDFVHHTLLAADAIIRKNRLPIIDRGSNSFIKVLVNDNTVFPYKYECCFLWMDMAILVLHSYVSNRVDQIVDSGLVEEGKAFFYPKVRDYDYGIRCAIGVAEMDEFFRSEGLVDGETRAMLL
ncbi:UNVERIFIED_CONTAM: Adenylate isopentenyltransferase 5, chloroplastic [Sesamum indicum]